MVRAAPAEIRFEFGIVGDVPRCARLVLACRDDGEVTACIATTPLREW